MVVAITVSGQSDATTLISVTGLTIGSDVLVERRYGLDYVPVRGGILSSITDTSVVLVDAESPFSALIPVTYRVSQNGGTPIEAAPFYNLAPAGVDIIIGDAISGIRTPVILRSMSERAMPRTNATFLAGGRNVVVHSAIGTQYTMTMEVLTRTQSETAAMKSLLSSGTGQILQLRTRERDVFDLDMVFTATAYTEGRYMEDWDKPHRIWKIDAVEVDPWDAALVAQSWSLFDIDAAYTPSPLQSLSDDYASLLAIAQHDWGL